MGIFDYWLLQNIEWSNFGYIYIGYKADCVRFLCPHWTRLWQMERSLSVRWIAFRQHLESGNTDSLALASIRYSNLWVELFVLLFIVQVTSLQQGLNHLDHRTRNSSHYHSLKDVSHTGYCSFWRTSKDSYSIKSFDVYASAAQIWAKTLTVRRKFAAKAFAVNVYWYTVSLFSLR